MDRERMANMAVAEAPTEMNVPEPRIDINLTAAAILGVVLVPWELEGLTGAPVLGAIPQAARKALPPSATLALTV
jgi:hypothetical protein